MGPGWSRYFKPIPQISPILYYCREPFQRAFGYVWYPSLAACWGNYEDLPTDIFPPSLLTTARTGILAKYKRNTFQPHVRSAVQSIIQQFVDEKITETRASLTLRASCTLRSFFFL
ncbi:hypothetical protein PS15p_209367 [Mucor circinelloides]